MSLTNFAPTLWARELNYQLYKSLVAMGVTNQDYEGEISEQGDSVRITRPASISTGSYTPGEDIVVEEPTSGQLMLNIDQAEYFAFEVDDVYEVQSNVELMEPYTQEAQYALADGVDQFIMETYAESDGSNQIAAEPLTEQNIYAKLREAKANLSNNNVPKQGRWAVLSPDEVSLLEGSEAYQKASDLGDTVSRNGFMGSAVGFMIFESNNVVEASGTRHLPYGYNGAITFAMQFSNVESQRREKRFSDLVKGLMLYGKKVIKPEGLGDLQNDISV